ncbi:MAG: bifunctional metallophosphatase/5'-nucleotidase [Pseudomonadaceae bacterium]|nr:bifunctional metallophosphatase/5'-nucleotidase [Pseudomonadaceae bacterium]
MQTQRIFPSHWRQGLTTTLLVLVASCTTLDRENTKTITLLFTNDVESAYEPVDAYWRDDINRIGGLPQLATLINRERANQPNTFLFDAGDIFTGTLARLTQGELSFELMLTMGYDAMVIGNHEFEYGWEVLSRQMARAPFPVLGANLLYRDSNIGFAQPYAIVERDGVRIGVIGILGQDAATALIPSNIAGLEVLNPIATVSGYVEQLRDEVDLIVVLTHQGATAPMQTDDEADVSVHRGNAENIALAGAVPGIDVILAGHTDAGTREPIVHGETGTLIMQTFGQGQHLGFLQITLDGSTGERLAFEGKLIEVESDALTPHPRVQAKLSDYKSRFPAIFDVLTTSSATIGRRYYAESDLGNLFADILREHTQTEVALMPSGALRADLPAGEVRRVDVLDAFPFEDRMAVMTMTGKVLRAILEQGLSLERGMLQLSGMSVTYDLSRPIGQRLIDASVNNEALDPSREYRVSTLEILAAGGDAYQQFAGANLESMSDGRFADLLEAEIASKQTLETPSRGRQLPAASLID